MIAYVFFLGVIALGIIGSFYLVGLRMKLRSAERREPELLPEDIDRLVDAVDGLTEQVDILTAGQVELQERLDFTERLLANPHREETRTPTPV